jgi:hypothetical protein
LTSLGRRVVLAPQLAAGFGIADLVIGRCLVEIKTVLEPVENLGRWLNQVLGYALLDWYNILGFDTLAVYLGWQVALISVSLTGLLANASPGPTPSLENLRADFRCAIQADLDQTVEARIRSRYPVPLLTNDTTVRT